MVDINPFYYPVANIYIMQNSLTPTAFESTDLSSLKKIKYSGFFSNLFETNLKEKRKKYSMNIKNHSIPVSLHDFQ